MRLSSYADTAEGDAQGFVDDMEERKVCVRVYVCERECVYVLKERELNGSFSSADPCWVKEGEFHAMLNEVCPEGEKRPCPPPPQLLCLTRGTRHGTFQTQGTVPQPPTAPSLSSSLGS